MDLWIRFSFYRDVEIQIKLHKSFRSKVREWKKSGLIDGAIMTYHFEVPNNPDNLYVCLDIPSVDLPTYRTLSLSQETLDMIPKEIMTEIRRAELANLTKPTQDRLSILDYEFNLQNSNCSSEYRGASIPEILRFASEGTDIALEVLNDIKTRNGTWKNDWEIANTIQQRVKEQLTTKREHYFGFHFVCNPVFLCSPLMDYYLRGVLKDYIKGNGQVALSFLYDAEKNGNFNNALNQHSQSLKEFLQRFQNSLIAEFYNI